MTFEKRNSQPFNPPPSYSASSLDNSLVEQPDCPVYIPPGPAEAEKKKARWLKHVLLAAVVCLVLLGGGGSLWWLLRSRGVIPRFFITTTTGESASSLFEKSYFAVLSEETKEILEAAVRDRNFGSSVIELRRSNSTASEYLQTLMATLKSDVKSSPRHTETEAKILGDTSFIFPRVQAFDDGKWTNPYIHPTPQPIMMAYVSSALRDVDSPDGKETISNGQHSHAGLLALYERRLLPVLKVISDYAREQRERILVTMSALGCGVNARLFYGSNMAQAHRDFYAVMKELVERFGASHFPEIDIWLDTYSTPIDAKEGVYDAGPCKLFPVHLQHGNIGHLSMPSEFAAFINTDGNFVPKWSEPRHYGSICTIVPKSAYAWIGNVWLFSNRESDEGVKTAATNVMSVLTGIQGRYNWQNSQKPGYYPAEPPGSTWSSQLQGRQIDLHDRMYYMDREEKTFVPLSSS